MTVIYAADKDSLALLPELLCALKVDESKLPSDGKYKEFKANTATLVSHEAEFQVRIGNAAAKTVSLAEYKGQPLSKACVSALTEKDIEVPTLKSTPTDKPKL